MNERRSPFLLVNLPASLLACCKSFHPFVTVKPAGFYMIAQVAQAHYESPEQHYPLANNYSYGNNYKVLYENCPTSP